MDGPSGSGILDALGWLIVQLIKGTLPKWAFALVGVCTVVGGAIGARMVWLDPREKSSGDTVLVLLIAGIGFAFSVVVLMVYQMIFGDARGYPMSDTIKGMTNEELLRIVTAGPPPGWLDKDVALVEQTLRDRGVPRPKHTDSQRKIV